jgi:hypothetical protein
MLLGVASVQISTAAGLTGAAHGSASLRYTARQVEHG